MMRLAARPMPADPAAPAVANGGVDFGVYVHWPFCAAKCPYCDFNSHVRQAPVDEARFVAAFCQEIAHARAVSGPRTVTSIFFGGGTPSLMRPQTVAAIVDAIAAAWHVPADIEVTLEANPSSVEARRFRGYRAAGVNRVSLGVQALNDADLTRLGRLHDTAGALTAIRLAHAVFARVSFDLIYARPAQTAAAWAGELEEAIRLAGDHLSLYQLTIEEGTPFFALHAAGKLAVPGGDHAAALYETTQEITTRHGLPAYEVSNHARPGGESRHNLTYWRYGDYAGIGPGAHGRLTTAGGKLATATERLPEHWLERVEARGNGLIECSVLLPGEQADELLLMGARLREGVDLARWRRLAGRDLDRRRAADLRDGGFVDTAGPDRLRLTPAGMLVLDAVIAQLAP